MRIGEQKSAVESLLGLGLGYDFADMSFCIVKDMSW
jgi:hypothetical protein